IGVVGQTAIHVNDSFIPSKSTDLVITAPIVDEPVTTVGSLTYVSGLREGVVSGTANFTAANPDQSLQLSPRLGEYATNINGGGPAANGGAPDSGLPWARNTTRVYSGECFSPSKVVSFGTQTTGAFLLRVRGLVPTSPL